MYNDKRVSISIDGGIIMKKSILVLMATLILTFALSTTCFAKSSPNADVLPTEAATDETGVPEPNTPNNSDTSPKTGVDAADTGVQAMIPFVVLITAAGVMLVAKKGFSRAE